MTFHCADKYTRRRPHVLVIFAFSLPARPAAAAANQHLKLTQCRPRRCRGNEKRALLKKKQAKEAVRAPPPQFFYFFL